MLFSELMEAELPKALRPDIDRLLDLKINSPELKMIPRIDRINGYLDASIEEIKAVLTETAEAVPVEWTRLNELFRKYAV